MCSELRDYWLNDGKSAFSKRIYNYNWPSYKLNGVILSKITTTWYHQIACGRGRFRERMNLFDPSISPTCRFGCPANETVDHIFTSCPHLVVSRADLKIQCTSFDLRYNLKSLFTDPRLQIPVERFLLTLISHT